MNISSKIIPQISRGFLASGLILLALTLFSNPVKAALPGSVETSAINGVQLASFYYGPRRGYWRGGIGFGPGYGYHRRGVYWTGWRSMGPRCQRTCLVNPYNGYVVRCKTRCLY